METHWNEIEQPSTAPLVQPVDAAAVDEQRKDTYLSYESFLRNRLRDLDEGRPAQWQRDYTSIECYKHSVEDMRTRLKDMLGFWEKPEHREPVERQDVETLLNTDDFVARRFTLEVLSELQTYAVELIPRTQGPHPGLLAQHGYAGTPELVCGLTKEANLEDYSYRSLGIRAVRRGFHVVAVHHPSGHGSLEDTVSGIPQFPDYPRTYGKNRLHRMAIMAGGTLFGLDMLSSSRGVDLLVANPDVDSTRIGMYGLSQGGMSALFLPAMDERIEASVCSAYFNWRTPKLIGPHRALCFLDSLEEDKFFSEVISHFSDADIVSLICPRAFAVEAGLHDSSVDFEKSQEEFERARLHYEKLGIPDRVEFIGHAEGHVSATRRAFEFLVQQLGC